MSYVYERISKYRTNRECPTSVDSSFTGRVYNSADYRVIIGHYDARGPPIQSYQWPEA